MRRLRALIASGLLVLTITPSVPHPITGLPLELRPARPARPATVINPHAVNDGFRWIAAAQQPVPTAVVSTSRRPKRVAASSDGSAVWDRIADCESSGDWAENTGNGYFGGLQMDMPFWHSYGGLEFAERPDLATREQQIVVAERARDSGRGYGPWPVCGRRAG